ncbi:HET-domain-containing protein [Trametes maxima]|nr:HET-domain-containing protein [Trametes maxima]
MWLLATDRAELTEFVRPPSKYAILSHVWEDDPPEQSFREVQEIARQCAGDHENPINHVSAKIRRCCQWAAAHGFAYLWIDTCCINKDSSAELSEAINSMFAWYAEATVCYTYLNDVSDGEAPDHPDSSFRKSRWFRRGWTLQELIAPKVVIFLSQIWIPIASKLHTASLIEEITGIDAGVLTGQMSLEQVSVARRMSWAASRETKRVEDRAYSLMGIFGVHLPTIYGEGKEAFIRLQEEIMRRIPDTTLFAWGTKGDPVEATVGYRTVFPTSEGGKYLEESTLLAPSPGAFRDCADLITISNPVFAAAYGIDAHKLHFNVTSHGIQATAPIVAFTSTCSLLLLPCRRLRDGQDTFVALVLRFQGDSHPRGVGTKIIIGEQWVEEDVRAGTMERFFAQQTTVRTRQSSRQIRCVTIPVGFDFSKCLQRPLNEKETPARPIWERYYIAYRLQHVLRGIFGRASVPLGRPVSPHLPLSRRPSRSTSYQLYFPEWVLSRLEKAGFSFPALIFERSPRLIAGERLMIPFPNRQEGTEVRMELRADVMPQHHLPFANPCTVASLWCSVSLPSEVGMSLVAQVSTLYAERSRSPASYDNETTVELDPCFVDSWVHVGRKGRKVFFDGRWRLTLTFTRLGEFLDRTRTEDVELCNMYIVDIDLECMGI